jgi:biopolymer transport protein ExbB
MLDAAAGLGVAIPAFIGHSYLTARVNDIIHDMERAGIEIVNLLVDASDRKKDAPNG